MIIHYLFDCIKRNMNNIILSSQDKKITIYGYIEFAAAKPVLIQVIQSYISFLYSQTPYFVSGALRHSDIAIIVVAASCESECKHGGKGKQNQFL